MFAEDVDLIPRASFTELLKSLRGEVVNFPDMVRGLWESMDKGTFSPILRQKLRRFNGGLFEDCEAPTRWIETSVNEASDIVASFKLALLRFRRMPKLRVDDAMLVAPVPRRTGPIRALGRRVVYSTSASSPLRLAEAYR